MLFKQMTQSYIIMCIIPIMMRQIILRTVHNCL